MLEMRKGVIQLPRLKRLWCSSEQPWADGGRVFLFCVFLTALCGSRGCHGQQEPGPDSSCYSVPWPPHRNKASAQLRERNVRPRASLWSWEQSSGRQEAGPSPEATPMLHPEGAARRKRHLGVCVTVCPGAGLGAPGSGSLVIREAVQCSRICQSWVQTSALV